MAEERKVNIQHSVIIQERELISITGVLDVISFDEENIIAETQKGIMLLKGINFHIGKLNLDKGELEIQGELINLTYEDSGIFTKNKEGFLSKIFK